MKVRQVPALRPRPLVSPCGTPRRCWLTRAAAVRFGIGAILAYADEHRHGQLYQTVFQQLLKKCRQIVASAWQEEAKIPFQEPAAGYGCDGNCPVVSAFNRVQFGRTKGLSSWTSSARAEKGGRLMHRRNRA